jgi:phosphoglycolate phosphatase-like HAD superfamily hydrolase
MPLINSYSSLVFDCDGVILDSNRIKTDAFYTAALPWGEAAAEALVAYHVANGGISRHHKFAHFLGSILPQHFPSNPPVFHGLGLKGLLNAYSQSVSSSLMTCPIADGLDVLRAATPNARWFICSGGDQAELRDIFVARKLSGFFDGGIFGSPDSKDTILARELASATIQLPALFLGDSRYDFEASTRAGFDFVFISGWSEFSNWQAFVEKNEISHVRYLACLLNLYET